MSKADAQRAMREANYERNNARIQANGVARKGPVAEGESASAPARTTSTKASKATNAATSNPAVGEGRCGHKSMNGRSCTREAGHPQKSHRYT